MAAIAEASCRGNTGEVDVRPAETIAALTTVLGRTLALLPASSPVAVRKAAERIAAQIRRQAIAAKTDPETAALAHAAAWGPESP
jgi:hypothetical protein